jgi:hypothetical protein
MAPEMRRDRVGYDAGDEGDQGQGGDRAGLPPVDPTDSERRGLGP